MEVTTPLAPAVSQYRRLADLPGPRPLPLLGNALQLDRSRIHQTMEQWSRQYGSLYRFHLPGAAMLVVTDP